MRLLFVFRDPGRVRYFEGPLELLAGRGHELHVIIESYRERLPGQLDFIEALAARHPNATIVDSPKRDRGEWAPVARRLRLALDHLHYLQPGFDGAPDFRARAARDAPAAVVALSRAGPLRPALRALLTALERAVPVPPRVERVLDEVRPDAVLVTPYIWFAAPQTDWVRGANCRGIHSAACVFSWDNLTSKGSLSELPELVIVWNEAQREEAVTLHGVPRERVAITGAQNWDHWFDWRPSRDRAELCREAGLDPGRPFLVWLESSGYVGAEDRFLAEWIERIRAEGGERTRAAGVLVRPHPQMSAEHWRGAGLEALENVAVWPRTGEVPLDERSRATFFDTLHHGAAVVGVNTSAFIESAIVGRPCLSLSLERFRKGQVNTVHFHHLLERNGGPLIMASSWEEHLAQLERALAEPERAVARGQAFVERFVRPHGLDVPAAPRVVEAIESLAAAPAPSREPRVLHRALGPLARLTSSRP